MFFKKHWKGILVSVLTLGVVGTSLGIFLWPRPITPIKNYLLEFGTDGSNEEIAFAKQANKKINEMKTYTKKVLDIYERLNPNFDNFILQYINLKTVQTDGEKNFFFSLDRTLKAIDSRLGFNNIQRTPTTLNQGFYNKDTELLSFYWSPDYNGVGTWLKYMFSDDFSMPNFWPSIYEQCLQGKWAGLKNELSKPQYGFKDGQNGTFTLFHNHPEIVQFVNDKSRNVSNASISSIYVSIANIIGKWVSENSTINVDLFETTGKNNQPEYILDKYSNIGDGIDLVNYISANPSTIPFVEDGYKSETPWLLRKGFYNQNNANTDPNFRDWFVDSTQTSSNQFRIWYEGTPFVSNYTPFNPSFSNAPTSQFFQSLWTGLTSWTTIGCENSSSFPYEGNYLIMNGSTSNMEDLKNEFTTSNQMTFKIRPIPWVDINGNKITDQSGNPYYLSPQDFLATIKAFIRSTQCGLNSNGYFIDLLGIDIDKILNDPKNNLRNMSPDEQKEFVLYFNNPTLSSEDCLDVLQKQYFAAIPAFKQSVINIIDDNAWNSIAVINPSTGLLNPSATDMSKFYGSGNWKETWKDLAFASPYYLNLVSDQNMIFKLNASYFDSFKNDITNPMYKSFILNDNNISKIQTIKMKYGGGYSDSILYEQFKANELDLSPVQSSDLLSLKNNPNLAFVKTQKINKSNLVGYNLQIYEKDNNGYILNNSNEPLVGENYLPKYSVDKFGNFYFGDEQPKIKPHVSKTYYDLIARNFFTPYDAKDIQGNENHLTQSEWNQLSSQERDIMNKSSIILRSTINNCINWVSLKTLVFPGISKSIQYSFMPYGVYQLNANINIQPYSNQIPKDSSYYSSNLEDFKKYWFLIASKRVQNHDQLSNRVQMGSMYWSYNEMLNSIIR